MIHLKLTLQNYKTAKNKKVKRSLIYPYSNQPYRLPAPIAIHKKCISASALSSAYHSKVKSHK